MIRVKHLESMVFNLMNEFFFARKRETLLLRERISILSILLLRERISILSTQQQLELQNAKPPNVMFAVPTT